VLASLQSATHWCFLSGDRRPLLFRAGFIIALISIADWKIAAEVPLGFLYLFPIVLVSRVLRRYEVLFLALLCMGLSELFDDFHWTVTTGLPRDMLYFAAFAGIGSYVYEAHQSRRTAASHLEQLEAEMAVRRGLEEQLEHLIETSPVAIVSADDEGHILLANQAAHRLFAAAGDFAGSPIGLLLPAFNSIPRQSESENGFRTIMQCKGHRQDGSIFIADVWFSTYKTSLGPRISAMISDASEEFRDREEEGLKQLLSGSRIVAKAIAHEVRNVCGAIALVHQNLVRCDDLSHNRDFEALGTLVLALEKIAAMELREAPELAVSVRLESFLEELRIVVEPALLEADIDVQWEVPRTLPEVWADRHSLMQVFLNLVRNSIRALAPIPEPRLLLRVAEGPRCVSIAIIDNGEGVSQPELLFRPFQAQAHGSGLGLCISRALMRTLHGDLNYRASEVGATFVVTLLRSTAS
jgi:signal transduction histidine kinase